MLKNGKMEGWIKLHRKFMTWEWYVRSEMVHIFIHLLLSANHESKKYQGIDIKRGQFLTSLDRLKNETGISKQRLRTILERMRRTGEINTQSNTRFTIITICNYESYQIVPEISNTQSNIRLTHDQHTINTEQEYK
jgi:hypothetical protein